VLSFGEKIGLRTLVNPLLAGFSVWLTYRLGKKTLGEISGLLAAGLTVTSPMFLMFSGMLLSHPWGLVLSAVFAISWLDAMDGQNNFPGWLPTLSAGFALGVLALSRPLTAFGLAIPFGIHGLILLWRGSAAVRRRAVMIGLTALLIASLHFLWQYALTGNAQLNPYTLWWDYDKIGFGPGHGILEGGHTLKQALLNTRSSLREGASDLFGWRTYSWIFIPFGIWAVRRNKKAWLLGSVPLGLIFVYLAYWVSGPRYYYEGLYAFTLFSAAGIAWLAGWIRQPKKTSYQGARIRMWLVIATLVLLVAGNLSFYTPKRLAYEHVFYDVDSARLIPFMTPEAQELAPALVLVHSENLRDYAVFLSLTGPYMDTPFIFAWTFLDDKQGDDLIRAYPERTLYHYYPDEPGRIYTTARDF